jgi:LacI family transcriptional regulator
LAFVQRRGDTVTTLLLVQSESVRPWFLRSSSTDYVGAGPALAWASALALQPDQELSLSLSALLLDRSIDLNEAPDLAGRMRSEGR